MNSILQSLLELVIQVSLWSLVAVPVLVVFNRWWPLRQASVAFSFLVGIVILSIIIWIPWPSWTQSNSATAVANPNAPQAETHTTHASTPIPWKLNLNSWRQWMPALPAESKTDATAFSLPSWPWWCFTILLGGIILSMLRLMFSFLHVRAHVKHATPIVQLPLLAVKDQLARQLKIRRCVRLLESPALLTPATVGHWSPVILLPSSYATWTEGECRAVLAHELAHIRRTDYLVVVMTQLVIIGYWFHPLVRWLSLWMRSGQELAADALAVQVLGDRASYLRHLCRLALHQDGARLPAPARLFLSPEVSLLRRVTMLRDGSPHCSAGRLSRWLFLAMLIVAGCLTAALRTSALDQPKRETLHDDATVSWQRYASADLPGYAVVYPAAALRLDSAKSILQPINEYCKEKLQLLPGVSGMGIPLDGIECFGGALAIQLQVNNQPGTGSMACNSQFLRFINAATAEAWIRHNTLNITKVESEHGVYYHVNRIPLVNQNGVCFIKPDARTIVFAKSEQEAKAWLNPDFQPATLPWVSLIPVDQGLASVFVNMQHKQLQQAFQQATSFKNGNDSGGLNPMLKPLYEHEGCMGCTVGNQDKLSLQFGITCASPQAATAKKKHIDALISVFKLIRVSGTTSAKADEEAAKQQMLVEFLNNVQSKQTESSLFYSTHSEQKLGSIIAGELLGLFGSPAK